MMKDSIGKNTISGQELTGFVERIEQIEGEQKQLQLDKAEIFAEAKARGFTTGAIRYVVKVRKEKPHDRQEREAMQDMYLHALGLDTEPPLFRFASLAAIDTSARDQVVERMKEFVPAFGDGHIDVKFGKTTIRLTRQKDGSVTEAEVEDTKREPKSETPKSKGGREKAPVPDVDEGGAYALGVKYAQDNRPVIDNPFPFGDPRRARFDEGWRKGNGGDGMGPEDD